MKRIVVIFIGNLCSILRCFSQNTAPEIFAFENFIQQVKNYHPLAKQASIQVDKAIADLQNARGAFDPVLELNASRKTFDGKNYYYYTNPQLTFPLPVGAINMGIESNGGENIFSETTKGKSSYLGVEIPLVKELILNKRRAVLQQAKILISQSEQERLSMFNSLIFEACIAYWQWAASYQQYIVYSKYTELARNRTRLVRIAFLNGDRAMADTVEAFTQVQNYQLLEAESLLKLEIAKLEMGNYLWLENYRSYGMPENYKPDSLRFANINSFSGFDDLMARSAISNPVFQIYNFKLANLEVERRLKYQSLLPYFSVKANLLNRDYNVIKKLNGNFLENNYKWGIDFRFPFFQRAARGDYKKAQLKIKETSIELINKRTQTENKIRTYFAVFNSLVAQLQTTQNLFDNYHALLRTEELKFAQGESSLFLVNTRELKVIEILQKQIELAAKCYQAKYAMEWAAGMLK